MKRIIRKLEKMMTAAAFAEAGEHDAAREIMREKETRYDSRDTTRPPARPKNQLRA
ncbi:MAG: hypothetical protein HZA16_02530 [Nitrospirae bacterium]|nr:hypothetical protein [Nitrospirota bacterium]